ncbi:DNA processing protein DprA [Leifsonia xyli subsp. xyli]|uniref:DNA processing factor n=2 Tax=Leifsonia xyli subsp. xyli TaxID=59736 RepID=Q6AEB0_LEIXX|nr:DNA-processing protein DprA [Leifsonia xyli]AAT89286.1 DNA processing factor [Leifsonia xyli subsp. xyli str. CTCB07]ODA89910.1 DNA processing protein DprA [Leifsonia xyli subsp. xyli]
MADSDTVLGTPVREMLALLRPVIADGADLGGAQAIAAVFAEAAFSTLVEPGDTDAVALLTALGARRTLRAVALGESGESVRERTLRSEAHDPALNAERINRALQRWRTRLGQDSPARALHRAHLLRVTLVLPDSPFWPSGLDSLEHGRPLALWVRGDPSSLSGLRRSISLVGSRTATGYGTHVALESSAGLSDRGFAILSGGALGIDAAAHRAAIASHRLTVCSLAGGADRLYPAANTELLTRILASGLILAELPPGSAPTRWRFLMRNRLIAAVSQATVVIEAGRRSGSLNTAGHAAQLGRPLGAVPGPVTSPESAGCHRLIREYAATCVTSAEEMAELADPFTVAGPDPVAEPVDTRILRELSRTAPRSRIDVAARTGIEPAELSAALGRMSALGLAIESAGGWRAVQR